MCKAILLFSLAICPVLANFDQGQQYFNARVKDEAQQALLDELKKPHPKLESLDFLAEIARLSGDHLDALSYIEVSLACKGEDRGALRVLSRVYNSLGLFSLATALFEQLHETDTQDAESRGELLKNYLRAGRFDDAQRLFDISGYWANTNAIAGQRVLLVLDGAGNGYGDQLMFVRYARYLKKAGAHVIVQAKKRLHPLLYQTGYIDEVTEDTVDDVDHRFTVGIGELMCLMQLLPQDDEPYLFAHLGLQNQWAGRLAGDKNFKVGIFWQGTIARHYFHGSESCGSRGVPFDQLCTLFDTENVSFYSLMQSYQLVEPEEVIEHGVLILDERIDRLAGSFMDSAAIIQNLDLVISSDSSMAHLAGALGVPVWLLLSPESDYRWMQTSNTTFWYPTMRLYRSKDPFSWLPLLECVKHDLNAEVTRSRVRSSGHVHVG